MGDTTSKSLHITGIGIAVSKGKGVDDEQFGRIVGGWGHLSGIKLLRVLAEFGKGVAKASAQPVVDFAENAVGAASLAGKKGFMIVTNFMLLLRQTHDPRMRNALEQQFGISGLGNG